MQLQNSSSKLNDASTKNYIEEEQVNTDTSSVEAIQTWLATKLAKQLMLKSNTIDVREPLTRYGLDSIDAVTLVGDLEDWLGLELPSTLFWDYPTLEKSAQYLVKEFDVSAALTIVNPEPVQDNSNNNTEESSASKGWGSLWNRISGS